MDKKISLLDKTIWLWLTGGVNQGLRFKRPSPPQFNRTWEWLMRQPPKTFCAVRLRSKAYRIAGVASSTLSAEYALNDVAGLIGDLNGERV